MWQKQIEANSFLNSKLQKCKEPKGRKRKKVKKDGKCRR